MWDKIIGFFALAAVSTIPLPPTQYQGDHVALVYFVDNPNSLKACGISQQLDSKGGPTVFRGCVRDTPLGQIVYLPNPCKDKKATAENYGSLVCHELGHVNGWPSNHPNAIP